MVLSSASTQRWVSRARVRPKAAQRDQFHVEEGLIAARAVIGEPTRSGRVIVGAAAQPAGLCLVQVVREDEAVARGEGQGAGGGLAAHTD